MRMKNFTTVLFVSSLVVIFLASSCGDNGAEKDTTSAKDQAVQQRDHSTKENSFSTGVLASKVRNIPPSQPSVQPQPSTSSESVVVNKGKQSLVTQLDSRVVQLGLFKSKVENTSGFSEPEKNSLVAELYAQISAFESFKPEINQSVTAEDVRKVSAKMQAEWVKTRLLVVRAERQLLAARENDVLADAERVAVGLQKRIDALKAAGKSAEAEEQMLAAYSKKISSAQRNVEFAQEKTDALVTAPTAQDKKDLMKGNELWLKSARDNTKEAYNLLSNEARREFAQRFKKEEGQ